MKRFTKEEVKDYISDLAQQVKDEMDYDYRVAQSQMDIAENDLVNTLNEEQLKLYKIFCEKRKTFRDIAREMYERKI